MKIFRTFDTFVIVCALFFIAEQVKSCEKECQIGISNAFASSYTVEITPFYKDFKNDSLEHLFFSMSYDSVSTDPNVIKQVTIQLDSSISDQIDSLMNTFLTGVSDIVKNAIFNEDPKMKGDCNNTVVQPPLGVNWTYQDCILMDKICGNPPSICHFIDLNKQKIYKDLKAKVSDNSKEGGDYITQISNVIKDVASKNNLTQNSSDYLVKGTSKNVQNSLIGFANNFNDHFCSDNCTKYDNTTIIPLLLSFP
ncbi:23316_t:CDS:1 [Cetraspora pellucida]|uniref:23316_t:CDS:1 n=1 Tax=Cetraspora pellucida TaxID=1433469 RepID=A0A9N9H074_9GLOM|nr:23316_t:CDS:1 [Cetraspora pellucida]